jgi:hypothetical protein
VSDIYNVVIDEMAQFTDEQVASLPPPTKDWSRCSFAGPRRLTILLPNGMPYIDTSAAVIAACDRALAAIAIFNSDQPLYFERTPMEPTVQKIDPPSLPLPGIPEAAPKQTRVRGPVTAVIALARIAKILEPLAEEDRRGILEMLANPIDTSTASYLASCERLLSHLDVTGRKQVLSFLATSEQAKGGGA